MIERTIVSVGGPAGSGKTTFVEHLLRAADRPVQAVRCHREPGLVAPHESAPADHPELKRYRKAGADGAAVYRFPEPDADALFCSCFMEDPSDVVLEGERPLDYVDLDVFIAPAPELRNKLLRRVKRNATRERRATVTRLRKLLASQDGTAQLAKELLETPLALLSESRPELLKLFRSGIATKLVSLGSVQPSTKRSERWAITKSYRGIERAQLVVINIRSDAQRQRGERALEDVLRLRKDEEVFQDVFDSRGRRTPITAVVANLSSERDPGLKQTLRRALRAFDRQR